MAHNKDMGDNVSIKECGAEDATTVKDLMSDKNALIMEKMRGMCSRRRRMD